MKVYDKRRYDDLDRPEDMKKFSNTCATTENCTLRGEL